MDFDRLNSYLRRYFKAQGLQAADIDDLVQTALLKIYKASSSFDSEKGSITTWATTIAKRCLVDLFRSKKPETELIDDLQGAIPLDKDTSEDIQYRIDLVMSHLSAKHKIILERKLVKKEPNTQLAKEAGITQEGIRWRLHEARKAFKRQWDKYSETVSCMCGCGIRLPKYNSRGKLRRFSRGHSRRLKKKPVELIVCACGCGEKTPKIGRKGEPVKYIKGHYNRENRKYDGKTRNERMTQSVTAKRKERRTKAEELGIEVAPVITKLCCACNQEKPTKWSKHYNADLTPIYFSRCIECKKAYQRERRKKIA